MAGDAKRVGGSGARQRKPDLTRLHRKAKAALAEAILPGESPLVVIHGSGASAIIATDRRAFVFKMGARAGAPFGYRLKEFEYESVMRVDLHHRASDAVVVIHAPLKISSCASYWADERDDAWKARNAIPLEFADRGAEEDVAAIGDLVAALQHKHDRERPATPSPERAGPGREQAPAVLESITELEREPSSRPVVLPAARSESCPNCGAGLRPGWQFCPRCGAAAAAAPDGRTQRRFFNSP
jgi:hypothetical protein